MKQYKNQKRLLVAVDCIIFGFEGSSLKLLLIHRGLEPLKGNWSLMGGFIQQDEAPDDAALRVLKILTGIEGVYLDQIEAFGKPDRDPIERTISIPYFALIDINKYKKQISPDYDAHWFPLEELPPLIFDHKKMVELAKQKLRYKAALHPLLFELLPKKFTLPQLQSLYESLYGNNFDKRNFSRKLLSTKLLIKQTDKDKSSSKKGAFYYKLNMKNYKTNLQAFLSLIPLPR